MRKIICVIIANILVWSSHVWGNTRVVFMNWVLEVWSRGCRDVILLGDREISRLQADFPRSRRVGTEILAEMPFRTSTSPCGYPQDTE